MMRFTLTEKKPLLTLQAGTSEPLQLFAADFEGASPHQSWRVEAPEPAAGEPQSGDTVIMEEAVYMGGDRFAVLRQLRKADGTEIAVAPEYFIYQHGKLFHPNVLEHVEEREYARRYPTASAEQPGQRLST